MINETGCELKKCSDYEITKCGDFDTYDSETSCVPFNGVCQERKCSDYKSPNCDDFIPYAWTEKTVLSAASTNAIKSKEVIFTNKKTYDRLNDERRKLITYNFAQQMTMEDLF